MKRRTFLATMGAVSVAPFAPALAFDQKPQYFRIETKEWLPIIRARIKNETSSYLIGANLSRQWTTFMREMLREHGPLELYVNHQEYFSMPQGGMLKTHYMPTAALYVAHRVVEVVGGKEIVIKVRLGYVT